MARDPRDGIDRLRRCLRDGERDLQYDADADHLLRFSDQLDLLRKTYSDHRHLKLLRHCTRMAENAFTPDAADLLDDFDDATTRDEVPLDIDDALATHGLLGLALRYRGASEPIVRWIHRTYDSEETNRDYRIALRMFGKRVERAEEVPESLSWVETGTSSNYNPVPSAADMLTWEDDVVPMIDHTYNARDKALFAVQFEAGCRSGEILELTVGDVFDTDHAMGIHVDGKLGEREVHLIISVPYLQRWLADHPGRGDADAPLWSKLQTPREPTYKAKTKWFREAADRAGVDKPTTPTNFRKSNMKWLIEQGMNQPRIEDRQGRRRGSKHTARYMSRFGNESNERAYAAVHGREVDEGEPDDNAPVVCPRCDRETPRHEDRCVWCHFDLTPEAAAETEAFEDDLFASLSQTDDEPTADDLLEARRAVSSNPALRRVLLDGE